MDVRHTVFPKGARADAEKAARELQDRIGGYIYVGEYLTGIQAWELWIAPPKRGQYNDEDGKEVT